MKHLCLLSLFFSLILTCPGLLHAHAVVTKYSLEISPIKAHQADQVTLNFNSQIELALSQVFLVRKGDKQELLPVSSKKRGEVVVQIPALEPGDYALSFKIFAADGHLTEDVIRFTVAEPETARISPDGQAAK